MLVTRTTVAPWTADSDRATSASFASTTNRAIDHCRRDTFLARACRRGYIDGAVVVYAPIAQIVIDVIAPFTP
jgi:hypothetical protein